jgi:hypothetical protein
VAADRNRDRAEPDGLVLADHRLGGLSPESLEELSRRHLVSAEG